MTIVFYSLCNVCYCCIKVTGLFHFFFCLNDRLSHTQISNKFCSYTYISDLFMMVEGCRGSRKLKVGDFSFTKNKSVGNRMYWSCARAGLYKCKARVLTIVESPMEHRVVVKNSDHNHDPF